MYENWFPLAISCFDVCNIKSVCVIIGFSCKSLKQDMLNHPELLELNATLAFEATIWRKQPSYHCVFFWQLKTPPRMTLVQEISWLWYYYERPATMEITWIVVTRWPLINCQTILTPKHAFSKMCFPVYLGSLPWFPKSVKQKMLLLFKSSMKRPCPSLASLASMDKLGISSFYLWVCLHAWIVMRLGLTFFVCLRIIFWITSQSHSMFE